MLKVPLAFLKKDYAHAASYKIYFGVQAVDVLFVAAIFYFASRVFRGVANPLLPDYGGDFFAFVFIGVAFTDYLTVSLTAFHTSIRESQMMGTLEILLMAPVRLATVLLCSSIWPYLFTSYRFALYLAAGAALFGLSLGGANVPGTMVVLLLSILSFAPLGILTASIVMVIKKGGEWSRLFVTGSSILLGGVAYPVSVLPDWMQRVAEYVPLTHALNGMRQALLGGYSLAALVPELYKLGLFGVVAGPLSIAAFHLATRRTKLAGTLAQY